jgi:hypothetical protein
MHSTLYAFTLLAVALCACSRTQLDAGAEALDGAAASVDAGGPDATTRPPDSGGSVTADGPPGVSDVGPEAFNRCFDSGCGTLDPGGNSGCCTPEGTCVYGNTTAACGVGGDLCRVCPPGDFCTGYNSCAHYQGNCGPTNCAGCCAVDAPQCAIGLIGHACGVAGLPCQDCALEGDHTGLCIADANGGGAHCSGALSGTGQCSSLNCLGCCDHNQCFVGTTDAECGLGGGPCKHCDAGATCTPELTGGCSATAPCNATTCSGCCTGGVCAIGSQDVACGVDGGACTDCTQSHQACTGSICQ